MAVTLAGAQVVVTGLAAKERKCPPIHLSTIYLI